MLRVQYLNGKSHVTSDHPKTKHTVAQLKTYLCIFGLVFEQYLENWNMVDAIQKLNHNWMAFYH